MRQGMLRAHSVTRRGIRLSAIAAVLAGIWLAGGGCAAPATSLTVTSLETRQCYRQGFTDAFARRDAHGDVDVVLACDTPTADGKVHADLKQVLHIRMLWSPGPGLKTDQPAATNAAIHWYVFTERGPMNMVEYTGTGLVEVDRDGDVTTVEIRNASLRPSLTAGALRDPIGPSRFEGTIVARANKQKVEEILSGVKTTLSAARLAQGRADASVPGER